MSVPFPNQVNVLWGGGEPWDLGITKIYPYKRLGGEIWNGGYLLGFTGFKSYACSQ